jgi:hypothetical protein
MNAEKLRKKFGFYEKMKGAPGPMSYAMGALTLAQLGRESGLSFSCRNGFESLRNLLGKVMEFGYLRGLMDGEFPYECVLAKSSSLFYHDEYCDFLNMDVVMNGVSFALSDTPLEDAIPVLSEKPSSYLFPGGSLDLGKIADAMVEGSLMEICEAWDYCVELCLYFVGEGLRQKFNLPHRRKKRDKLTEFLKTFGETVVEEMKYLFDLKAGKNDLHDRIAFDLMKIMSRGDISDIYWCLEIDAGQLLDSDPAAFDTYLQFQGDPDKHGSFWKLYRDGNDLILFLFLGTNDAYSAPEISFYCFCIEIIRCWELIKKGA